MKLKFSIFYIFFTFLATNSSSLNAQENINEKNVTLIILGTIQDAGSPHIACKKDCCKDLFEKPEPNRKVVSLGLIDHQNKKKFLFEATPDIVSQLKNLKQFSSFSDAEMVDGIFLTHAHIGHYAGLMYLGKEAMNTNAVPIYAMPKMKDYLNQNGPWSQLVKNNNINIQEIYNHSPIQLTSSIQIIPFTVPHRDELSETVGYKIIGPNKKALFIPDIDKWEKWATDIIDEIANVDYAFIDGTFFDANEINNRNIAEIPHPFIIESMGKFKNLSLIERNKIYFIHFNHTNPVIKKNSSQKEIVLKNGFNIAGIYNKFNL